MKNPTNTKNPPMWAITILIGLVVLIVVSFTPIWPFLGQMYQEFWGKYDPGLLLLAAVISLLIMFGLNTR